MPLRIHYKIHKKPAGNYRPYVEMTFNVTAGRDAELAKGFSLAKSYPVPDSIFKGPRAYRSNGKFCFDRVDIPIVFTCTGVHSYSPLVCDSSQCPDGCPTGFYLPYRKGKSPDYSDFAAVLDTIARDVITAWDAHVARVWEEYKARPPAPQPQADGSQAPPDTPESEPVRRLRLS